MSRFQQPQLSVGKFAATPSSADPPDSLYPAFSLRYVEKSYCLSKCDKNEKAAFASKLLSWSKMTWAAIKQADRHGLGHEIIKQLEGKLPSDAPKGAHALAFRFHAKAPMVGFRDGNVFYIVWFDRQFKLYKH